MEARKPAAKVLQGDSEERLLVEAAQSDPAKFGDLYEIHFERIYAFIARRVRERHTVEDLTSEVFHKALANLRNYEWRGAPFGAWLIRIAAHAIADHARPSAREAAGLADTPGQDAPVDLEAVEHRARLFRLVGQLPAEQRRVIFELFVEEKSTREIALQLGKTEGAVKQL